MEPSPILCWCKPEQFAADFSGMDGAFRLHVADTPEALLEAAGNPEHSALLFDPEYKRLLGRDLLREVREARPDLPTALSVCTNESQCFTMLRSYGVGASLPKRTPLDALATRIFFEHLTGQGAAMKFEEHLPGSTVRQVDPRNPIACHDVLQSLRSDLKDNPYLSEHDLHLVFEEAVNNVLFHAFVDQSRQPKYNERCSEPFEETDQVRIGWVLSERGLGLTVTDSRGSLAPGTVWDQLHRQTSMDGLFDTHGRGLFITHKLSTLILITIRPGAETSFQMLFSGLPEGPGRPISLRVPSASGSF